MKENCCCDLDLILELNYGIVGSGFWEEIDLWLMEFKFVFLEFRMVFGGEGFD